MYRALVLLVCLAGLGGGCSALSSRALNRLSTPPPPLYFGGARTDYQLIASSKETDSPVFWSVYGVVDMPFSLGTDVLLIPYDAYTDWRHGETAKQDLAGEAAP